jgi:ubiquitin conjugation factor E4 B
MKEPVTLPTSKVSIDLATIKSHLLSDPTDPFNRSPLKIEDVIPSIPRSTFQAANWRS